MKLVEILAKEWKEWPHGCDHAVCDSDGEIRAIGIGTHNDFYPSEAVDVDDRLSGTALLVSHDGKAVTRADWEKEKMKQAVPKKNAEGWIRHRGGKCPVEAGVNVDVRYRSGMVNEHVKALEPVNSGGSVGLSAVTWEHYGSINDIMAYRLHKPAEQVEACSKPELQIKLPDNYGEIIGGSIDGPLQWRDRIAEIDSTTMALTTEREELVQKLASEGFALIGPVKADNASVAKAIMEAGGEFYSKPVEDMSDWRNWKVGDFVESVSDREEDIYPGGVYKIYRQSDNAACLYIIDGDGCERNRMTEDYKFFSRPST